MKERIIEKSFYKKELGKKGEEIAINFLKGNGYIILERNFLTKFGEIDIIAKKNDEYIFTEVKTRTSRKYGRPSEAINNNKIKHIKNACQYYILKNNLKYKCIRFDVIEIYYEKKVFYINHIKNLFY